MVEFKFVMETPPVSVQINPPRLIPSLVQGFNLIAQKFYLILPPILLDLFLWFGPRLSFESILNKSWTSMIAGWKTYSGMQDVLDLATEIWQGFAKLNFFSLLRSLPVGLTSLLWWRSEGGTPLKLSPISLTFLNEQWFVLLALGLFTFGIFLGALFFKWISEATISEVSKPKVKSVFWMTGQSVLLTFILLIMLILLSIPVSLFSNILLTAASGLAEIGIFILGMILIWLLLPLVFSAHGIFVEKLNAVQSIRLSVQLVRTRSSGAGFFITIVVLLNMGLNLIWNIPPSNSWWLLIGIIGHAFIYTALVASSFFYFRSGLSWLKEKSRQASAVTKIN